MSLYHIPHGNAFLESLSQGLIERYGDDPLHLSQIRIFLPTKRACLALGQHLASSQESGLSFMPKLIPLGEFGLEHIQDCLDPLALIDQKPLSSLRRQFLLAHLILKWGEAQGDEGPSTFDHALNLAESLGGFFDQLQVEQIDFAELSRLVPQEFAHHWQATLSFLHLVVERWPAILSEEKFVDRAVYRNLLFTHLLEALRDNPPSTPVIVAGSTGTFSMTARLMKIVTDLPQGAVVLSGLDKEMDETLWIQKAESPTHPQHPLMLLCRQNDWQREKIKLWSEDKAASMMQTRRHYIQNAFSHLYYEVSDEAFHDVSLFECQHIREEAQLIALLIKDHWLHDKGDIAVITSDQMLIRYVESLLSRWNISLDNSAGQSLRRTEAGIFFMQILEVMESNFGNVEVLTLLKSLDTPNCAALEKKLRSPDGLGMRLIDDPICDHIEKIFKPFEKIWRDGQTCFSDILEAHISLFETLFSQESPYKEELIIQLQEVSEATRNLPAIPVAHYAESIKHILKQAAIRPPRHKGRSIYVWGSIEARLQKTEVVILAGLNEGTWPREIKPDPWINRSMRATLGLPPLERRIGLNAQDFCQALCSEKVYLTRSEFVDGKVQLPSRFLHMLRQGLDEAVLKPQKPYLAWARKLDHPDDFKPAPQPLPKPDLTLRPRVMAATHVEQLVKNPYGYYARFILGLKPLDPLAGEPHAAQFGTLIHHLLEQHKKTKMTLSLLAKSAFDVFSAYPHILFFWMPRFLRIASWFEAQEEKRKDVLVNSFIELEGKMTFETSKGKFTLKAKADRIDILKGGLVEIIDYKTGMIPTKYQMQIGAGAQLLLEALIAKHKGFGLPEIHDIEISYWRLKGKKEAGDIKSFKDLETEIENTEKGLRTLVAFYEDENHGYKYGLEDAEAIKRDPYRLLSRVDEWGSHAA